MAGIRCDLHVHSRFSTDSGNYALRRARLGESYTEPERVYDVCRARGLDLVTITDHNTLQGALRVADRPGTFLSEEVTTRFPEDDVVLHVLVWNLTEEDHRDLQPYRSSVYELQAFLASRGLAHALAHPLYRMGPEITPAHVERMMLLFGVWEGRNGARPRPQNELACRLARRVTPAYLDRLAERHGLAPRHGGSIALVGGSDDHGAIDIATTWTEAEADAATAADLLAAIDRRECAPGGEHGSPEKLAHAMMALFLNAYRAGGGSLPEPVAPLVEPLFDDDATDARACHEAITGAAKLVAHSLGSKARDGGFGLAALTSLGPRLTDLVLAGALRAPFLGAAHHQWGGRRELRTIEEWFFGKPSEVWSCRTMVFTDTLTQTNGVAGTMRRLAERKRLTDVDLVVVTSTTDPVDAHIVNFTPEWSLPLPTSEHIALCFPDLLDVLDSVGRLQPDVIHVATPGPVGLSGLVVARLLGIPVVGSYHTELGPYTLHLTRDLVMAQAMGLYVDWFYGRCDIVLAPTRVVADSLVERRVTRNPILWGRGVDTDFFTPLRRRRQLRDDLLGDGELLLLSVSRLSAEKRIDVLLTAFADAQAELPGLRLAVVGDGPERTALERRAGAGVTFLGELRGDALADVYASADVFCFPSTTDTFGQVILEAGASALPVVAAAAGGALELVRPGVTGLLVDPDDPADFARALLELARSESLRKRLQAGGREAALRRTWEGSLFELREAYRTMFAPQVSKPEASHLAA